jgi:NAD(P)H-hydrate epimerase
MKIFSAKENKELDEFTVMKESITQFELMERAASAVTYEIISRWRRNTPVVVFAGPGNNGGDAMAVARMLSGEGYTISVYFFNPTRNASPLAQKNFELLSETSVKAEEVVLTFIPPELSKGVLVVDGLFGVGLNRTLTGGYVSLAQYINESGASVLSIDIPSGLFSEDNSGNEARGIIKADITITFQYPKLAFLLEENAEYVGEWKIADIGISPEILAEKETPLYYMEAEDVVSLLKRRPKYSDKRQYGHLLLVAGSAGMMGAAVMASKAALRAGAGLVSIHSAACGEEIIQTSVPEAMFIADSNMNRITNCSLSKWHNVVAVGPGIGRHRDTLEALNYLLNKANVPLVIDADALNIIAETKGMFAKVPKYSVITPHKYEFDRLFGASETMYQRLLKAKQIAVEREITIVLKGANTAVVKPTGEIYFNSTGNPGMATAGSGDVLTGIIASLIAQNYAPSDAATIGVFLHGMAGDIALEEESIESLLATDIIKNIGRAYKKLRTYNL